MIKQILDIFQQLKNKEKWNLKQLENCAYNVKWRQIQDNIETAKKSNDFIKIQNLHVELQWLVSIRKFDFENEVVTIRQKEDYTYWATQPKFKFYEGLDTKKIQNMIDMRYNKKDLIPPITFELTNEKHKAFVLDVITDFETINRQTKFDGLPIEEKSLSFPKKYTYDSLTFFSLYCTYEQYYIEPDYALELRNALEKFN